MLTGLKRWHEGSGRSSVSKLDLDQKTLIINLHKIQLFLKKEGSFVSVQQVTEGLLYYKSSTTSIKFKRLYYNGDVVGN